MTQVVTSFKASNVKWTTLTIDDIAGTICFEVERLFGYERLGGGLIYTNILQVRKIVVPS